jgi:hypothetical protein
MVKAARPTAATTHGQGRGEVSVAGWRMATSSVSKSREVPIAACMAALSLGE